MLGYENLRHEDPEGLHLSILRPGARAAARRQCVRVSGVTAADGK